MTRNIRWLEGDRIERKARIDVSATAEELFPLLCPVREYEWIPGWACEMIWSESGFAELDAAFTTRVGLFGKSLWTCVVYEPPRRIEYLRTEGSTVAIRLALGLSENAGRTALDWSMRCTAAGPRSARRLRRRLSEEKFGAMIEARSRELSAFFKAKAAS